MQIEDTRTVGSADEAEAWAQACAFLGNSLLAPMSQTEKAGIDPAFWEAFPAFGDEKVATAVDACAEWARANGGGVDAATRVSVEYTHLFVGPPKPAVLPWETAYRGTASDAPFVGFGEATVAMRHELAAMGLAVSRENNQYADHMGIELLCLSEKIARAASGGDAVACPESADGAAAEVEAHEGDATLRRAPANDARAFAIERPLSWCDAFAARVRAERPDGYYTRIVDLACTLLHAFVRW